MNILIVDDEEQVTELLKKRLINKGHAVHAAYDGEDGLELLKANTYDLVLLDHNMPGLTGLELVKYIKEKKLETKTVMISGYAEIDEPFMKHIGADEFLIKPVKLEDIDAIVEKYSK